MPIAPSPKDGRGRKSPTSPTSTPPSSWGPKSNRWTWLALAAAAIVGLVVYVTSRPKPPAYDVAACTREKEYARVDLATWAPTYPRPRILSCPAGDAEALSILTEWDEKQRTYDTTEGATLNEHLLAAGRIWAIYDSLVGDKKTKDAFLAAAAEAKGQEAGLSPSNQRTMTANNASSARQRMAWFINPKSRTSGPWHDTLIPSDNYAECLVWGSQWSKEAESMKSLGFKRLSCAASTTTGQPGKEWTIE